MKRIKRQAGQPGPRLPLRTRSSSSSSSQRNGSNLKSAVKYLGAIFLVVASAAGIGAINSPATSDPGFARSEPSEATGCLTKSDLRGGTTILSRVHFSERDGQNVQPGGRAKNGFKTAKVPVAIRGSEPVTLSVPRRLQKSIQIAGLGTNDSTNVSAVVEIVPPSGCDAGEWPWFAGGFNFRGKHCLPLRIEADDSQDVFRIGLGTRCRH